MNPSNLVMSFFSPIKKYIKKSQLNHSILSIRTIPFFPLHTHSTYTYLHTIDLPIFYNNIKERGKDRSIVGRSWESKQEFFYANAALLRCRVPPLAPLLPRYAYCATAPRKAPRCSWVHCWEAPRPGSSFLPQYSAAAAASNYWASAAARL